MTVNESLSTKGRLVPLPYRRDPACPFHPDPELQRVSDVSAVVRVPLSSGSEVCLITRYWDARRVLADVRFSTVLTPLGVALPKPVERTLAQQLRDRQPGTFLECDPPAHTRLRQSVAAEFTEQRMKELRPRIEEIVHECLDAMEDAGPPVDLVEAFALPVPSRIICEMLGIPYDGNFDFAGHSHVMSDVMAAPESLLASRDAMRGHMRERVREARRDPAEGILGRLVRTQGDRLSDEELVGIGNLLLIAGHETTATMLGAGTLVLLHHPGYLAIVRDGADALDDAIEELVRYVSIASHGAVRTATEDVYVGGELISAGENVIVSLPMANRDAARYAEPFQFDINRPSNGALAWGYGIHHCIGKPLAYMEMRIAFPALLRRFPNLALAVPPEKVPFRVSQVTYGVEAMPVTW